MSQAFVLNQAKIPQYGQNKVKSPNCILLWSSLSPKKSKKSAFISKLLSKHIRLEQLNGAKAENATLRNQLFNISRKKGKYPQVFIKDEKEQIRFIGLHSDINVW